MTTVSALPASLTWVGKAGPARPDYARLEHVFQGNRGHYLLRVGEFS